jgi:hypothetical protein
MCRTRHTGWWRPYADREQAVCPRARGCRTWTWTGIDRRGMLGLPTGAGLPNRDPSMFTPSPVRSDPPTGNPIVLSNSLTDNIRNYETISFI